MDRRRPLMTRGTGRIPMTYPDPEEAGDVQSGRQDAKALTGKARPSSGAAAPGSGAARPANTPTPARNVQPPGFGWSVFSYMIGGMILYGGIGWLVGRWTHLPALFPIGMIVGLALAIVLVIFRVTRS
jgi:hypothetical protein